MAGRGNPFSRDYSTGNSSEGSVLHIPIPEGKGREHLYLVDNKVVNKEGKNEDRGSVLLYFSNF